MAQPSLKISKLPHDRFKVDFTTDDGHITCEVALRKQGDPPDPRPDAQKQESALGKVRLLAQALDAALADDE